jgi:hypothetical protein
MKKDKKAIGMSFNWLFAIIVGIFILFLAIYIVVQIVGVGDTVVGTESAARLVSFLGPAEAGIASGKVAPPINFQKNTRLYFSCSEGGSFGHQKVSFSEVRFGKWSERGNDISTNKYVFANEIVEGKTLYLFSKPFDLPFKVADLIIMSSEKYCFVEASRNIEEEVRNLKNVRIVEDIGDCEGVSVCFGSGNCDIVVRDSGNGDFKKGSIKKGSDEVFYFGGLLYAGIMSSPEIYECNVKRLMKKFRILSEIYEDKIAITRCGDNVLGILNGMKSTAKDVEQDGVLSFRLFEDAEDIENLNDLSGCIY